MQAVSLEQLTTVATLIPEEPKSSGKPRRQGHAFDLETLLDGSGMAVIGPREWQGGKRWVFPVCPWNEAHTDRSAFVVQFASGAIAAGCHHNGCQGRDWRQLRELLQPGWREQVGHIGRCATGEASADGKAQPNDLMDESEERPAERDNQASRLVRGVTRAGVELFHYGDEAYATVPSGDHRETYRIRSSAFRLWLRRLAYRADEARTLGEQALNDALGTLEAKARFDGSEHAVFIRLAEHEGRIYLDLCDAKWQAIEIGPDGWRVVSDPPVRFVRAKGMEALPLPECGGSVEDLWHFVNVADEADRMLVIGFLLACLRSRGPFPVLVFHGEQGSAKSCAARILRLLIDPNSVVLRAEPREARDLAISAGNAWVIALDNISRLPVWLSDALCRLATGGGFATRTLYENTDETLFDAQRPIILTGINEAATRPDLLDRALLIELPVIPERSRRDEERLWQEFEDARPRILGALLDAVAAAVRNHPSTRLERAPRMADFARWCTAAEPGLGWPAGSFLKAYSGNRDDAHDLALEASPIARWVRELAKQVDGWKGTASDMLAAIAQKAGEAETRHRDWPKTPRGLKAELVRIAPNLRAIGIEVTYSRKGHAKSRMIYLCDVPQPSTSSAPSALPFGKSESADGRARYSPQPSAEPAALANPNSCLVEPSSGGADEADDTAPFFRAEDDTRPATLQGY